MKADDDFPTLMPTRFGFDYGAARVERVHSDDKRVVITIRPVGGYKDAVDIYVSRRGRSIRVFRGRKELKA